MKLTLPDAVLKAALTALIGPTGPLNGATVALATNTNILTNKSVLADVIFATYGGYADSTPVVWGAVHTAADGTVQATSDAKTFAPTDTTVNESITYAVLLNAAGDTLLGACALDQPVHLGSPADWLTVLFPALLGQTSAAPQNVLP